MLYIENTTNNLGVAIYGDYQDFESVYNSLHNIVGDEYQNATYEQSRLRVLGICYDIRHAMQGDRDYEFVDNGITSEIQKYRGFIAPNKNLYLKVNVLWPEMLYVQMVLNDFVMLYAKGKTKGYTDVLKDKKNIWDESIANVRLFQAAVNKCIKANVTDATYRRMLGTMISSHNSFNNYMTQYLDYLNMKFMETNKEKRLKNISIIAKRIAEKGEEYRDIESDIIKAARKYECSVEEIRLNEEYPDDYEW